MITKKSLTNSEAVSYHRATISSYLHQQKSHTYNDELIAEMAKRLVAISLSMGFVKSNSAEIMLALSKWIKEQFGDMSMQDVSLAFDLVTAKKIGSDIRHYNSFSKQYIGDVLYAFRTFRNKQLKAYEESLKVKEIQERATEPVSGEEMYSFMKKLAVEKGEIMRIGDWSGAFNYAWTEKLIHRMNKKERKAYKKSTKQALESEKRANFLPSTFNIDDSLQSECHKRIMQCHFQEMIDNKSN